MEREWNHGFGHSSGVIGRKVLPQGVELLFQARGIAYHS